MVGFGDRIKGLCEDRPEWASYYVDYKSLKKIIKLIIAGEDVAEAEEGFALCLESELAKVESFFRLKEGNFASQLKQLAKRVSGIEEGIAGGSECDTLVDMLKLLEGNSDVAQLLKDLLSFASAIDDIREFVFANVQATIKITKKHDKHSRIVSREDYCNIMHGCLFYTSPLLGKLIRDTKMLVSTVHFSFHICLYFPLLLYTLHPSTPRLRVWASSPLHTASIDTEVAAAVGIAHALISASLENAAGDFCPAHPINF